MLASEIEECIRRTNDMKINQVAELVDITKKNIRFYEDQGLVNPGRDPQNGYREYSLGDVSELKQVKLLRQLGVSCENIRRMRAGELSLENCMKERLIELEEADRTLEHTRDICTELSNGSDDISSLDAAVYLERMKEFEKGGVRFMDIKKSDVQKRRTGAIIAAVVVVVFVLGMIAMVVWANSVDPAPKGIIIFLVAIFGSVIIGVLIALIQRLKELEGGE